LSIELNRVAPILVSVIVCTSGCSPGPHGYRAPEGTPIVLISIDTLRSDRLPAYGYDGVESPAVDGLRRDGILFERAYTHVPLTLPAHASLLTGLLPPDHGVRDNLGYTIDPTRQTLLQQTLQDAGYATGAAVSAFVLRGATGIEAGFEFYEDRFELRPNPGGPGIQAVQRPGGETLEAVRPWLRSVADRPFFLFFHIFEPHTPYDPPAEYAARYESAYDGEVAASDGIVGDLLDELRDLDVYDDSLIFLLSDHGEGLGEHGEAEHGVFLYRSTLQVPLILKLPKSKMAGETVDRAVQLIDVYPTVVEALGLPANERLQGETLLAREGGSSDNNPVYSETLYPRLHFGWSDLAAVIVDRHHFIDAPLPELYDLFSDPDEMDNLVGSNPVLESELEASLRAWDRQLEAPAATDAETRRRLQALGYVGEATLTDADALPDPKEKIGLLRELRIAHRHFADGDLDSAIQAFTSIVATDPGIEDAWEYLALSQVASGRPEHAAETYFEALGHLPHSSRLSLRAGNTFFRLGRLDTAAVYARNGVSYDPAAAHALLAQIALVRGDLDGAEIEARRAVSVVGDRRPEARLILADILIARGEPGQAAELLSRALDEGIRDESIVAKLAMTHLRLGEIDNAETVLQGFDDTDDAGILVALGRTAMARGRSQEAKRWLERAHRVAPTDPTVKLNLGIAAMSEGRLAEAENYFEQAVAANPASFDGWNALGSVRGSQGDLGGAIEAWERALQINPMLLQAIYNLGVAHAQAGRPAQAADYLEDFAVRAPPGPRRDRALEMAEELRQASQKY
jgi:arylsulfatase A-like enzyme/Tfp pilus assembly protein PilF